jgi:hypothetical protein
MSFDVDRCSIPTVWCGSKSMPSRKKGEDKYYVRRGTPHECMKIGVGAGIYSERKKGIPATSLQNIKYVGEVYEKNFMKKRIRSLNELIKYASTHSSADIKKTLSSVFKKKGGAIDQRAYNSTLMYIYRRGIHELPQCLKISSKSV